MKVIISILGSGGDVHPFLAIGKGLKDRGHDVLMLSSEYYKEEIEKLPLRFKALNDIEAYNQFVYYSDPDKMPDAAPRQLEYLLTDPIKPTFDIITEEYEPGNTVLICWSWNPGIRIAQDKLHIPTVTIHLSPRSFQSYIKPPKLREKPITRFTPQSEIKKLYDEVDTFLMTNSGKAINEFRIKLDLPPIDSFLQWTESPDRIIGLFPEWFAKKQKDWPKQTILTTFPLYGNKKGIVDDDIREFLKDGNITIAVTPGTHFKHAKNIFYAAQDAISELKIKGIFLTKYEEQIPDNIPKTVLYKPYADFSVLLPEIDLLIHHGGSGTTAQALHAGIPQIIAPWGNDQFDHAELLRKMGVADEVHLGTISGSELAKKIKKLISSKKVKKKCLFYSEKMKNTDPLQKTLDVIEGMV